MSGFADYEQYDGLGLAELVKTGQVSPAELTEAAISRIEERNPKLNAVVRPLFRQAREAAAGVLPDGPFKGVPFLIKDLLAAYAGEPLTYGSRAYRNYIPRQDSELVRRFKAAGLVITAKTNTPEFGTVGYTEPELFGPCRNPWNLDHTPGGSSGGSASAVAAGFTPMASGGDGGGSIRIPAACCGLFGIKPSRGRNPMGPDIGESWQGAVVEHAITRSVRDSAALLDATHGMDPGAPYTAPPPERPFLEETRLPPGRLRIAFCTDSPIGTDVHPECVKAVENAVRLLESLGHHVERAAPAVDGKALGVAFLTMVFGEVAAEIRYIRKTFGPAAAAEVELPNRTVALMGEALTAGEFALSKREWNLAARAMGLFFQDWDLYLTPALARPPVRVGELHMSSAEAAASKLVNALGAGKLLKLSGMVEKVAYQNLSPYPFTQLGNVCGLPSMSLPLHWTPDGLPLGVLINGPYGHEGRLFRLAAQVEQAAPWFNKRPPGFGG